MTDYNHEEDDLYISLGITDSIGDWMLDKYIDSIAVGDSISQVVENIEKEFEMLDDEEEQVLRYILAEAVGHIDKRARDKCGVGANLQ